MKSRDLSLLLEPIPEALPALRDELRSWLTDQDATRGECDDIILACWEAAVNALEQPVAGQETIHVVAERFDDDVLICVADRRAERRTTASRPDDRHLGLKLMVTLMDRVQILDAADGTRIVMSRCLGPSSAAGLRIGG